MDPQKYHRTAVIERYLPPTLKDAQLLRRLQSMRRSRSRFPTRLIDFNILACAYALGADGAVIDVLG